MSHQNPTVQTPHEPPTATLSFEVREVVSLLAAFEAHCTKAQAEHEDSYDPFAPGFPGTH